MLENAELTDLSEEGSSQAETSDQVKKQNLPSKNNIGLAMDTVLTRFTSCGRCSLFLAVYRISNDDQALETALANSDKEWLKLPWERFLRELLFKSYGCRLDADVYFFESSCPECLGKFRYSKPEDGEQAFLMFKI